jgi:hypothetical protein
MATHSIQTWRITLDRVSAWNASSFLLDSLVGYANSVGNGFDDREQTYNFLLAWRLATPPGRLRKVNGHVPITEGRLSIQNLRNAFSKLSAAAAADLIVEKYLSDPICGFADSVAIIATALTAWGEVQLAHHDIGIGIAPEPSPHNAA